MTCLAAVNRGIPHPAQRQRRLVEVARQTEESLPVAWDRAGRCVRPEALMPPTQERRARRFRKTRTLDQHLQHRVPKPIDYTAQECFDLVQAAVKSRRVFQSGHHLCYGELQQNAQRLITTGEIGRVTLVRGQCRNTRDLI